MVSPVMLYGSFLQKRDDFTSCKYNQTEFGGIERFVRLASGPLGLADYSVPLAYRKSADSLLNAMRS
jgi:hypothetical protein